MQFPLKEYISRHITLLCKFFYITFISKFKKKKIFLSSFLRHLKKRKKKKGTIFSEIKSLEFGTSYNVCPLCFIYWGPILAHIQPKTCSSQGYKQALKPRSLFIARHAGKVRLQILMQVPLSTGQHVYPVYTLLSWALEGKSPGLCKRPSKTWRGSEMRSHGGVRPVVIRIFWRLSCNIL